MNILVTGAAGFIGFHLVNKLCENKKWKIIGLDNINNYYDINLKKNRLQILKKNKNFFFKKIDLCKFSSLEKLFKKEEIKIVINLAAQAGVRYSIENPEKYFESNLKGFFNIINLSRVYKIKHFLYASTSSVYGNQKKFPLKEEYNTDKPLSFYAATKKCNEVIAHSYSNIYGMATTGLRFFTVYGPYGRPDMALFKFANLLRNNKKIKLFNNGDHERDFTYISDIVHGIVKLLNKPSSKSIPFEVYNIGGNKSYKLMHFINLIERNLKIKAKFKKYPLQQGDVKKTQASTHKLDRLINKKEYVDLNTGVKMFFNWFNKKHDRGKKKLNDK